MIYLRIDVIKKMKENGFTTTRLHKDKILSSDTVRALRRCYEEHLPLSISTDSLNRICLVCGMQPGEIIEVFPSDEEKLKYFHVISPSEKKKRERK